MSDRVREDGYALSMLIGFWLAAVVNLGGEASGIDLLSVITKPFLMLFLFFWAWQVLGRPKPRAGRWLVVGILFAWLGDVLLMLAGPDGSGPMFFLLGLVGFLGMQLCYILAFWSVPGDHLLRRVLWLVVPFGAYWAVMNWFMDPGGMLIPVLVYSAALVGMSAFALDLTARFPRSQAWPLFVGSVLFVLSDSLLALNAFGGINLGRWQGFAVMATYIVAQFGIVTRFVRGLNQLAAQSPSKAPEAVDIPAQPEAADVPEPAITSAAPTISGPPTDSDGELPEQPAAPDDGRRELLES